MPQSWAPPRLPTVQQWRHQADAQTWTQVGWCRPVAPNNTYQLEGPPTTPFANVTDPTTRSASATTTPPHWRHYQLSTSYREYAQPCWQSPRCTRYAREKSERFGELEFSLAAAQSELQQVRDDEARVRNDLNYVQSQSMRSNLVFGISESTPETWEVSEM